MMLRKLLAPDRSSPKRDHLGEIKSIHIKGLVQPSASIWTCVALAFLVILFVPPAHAVQPDEVLDDPALEARARDISKILRCVVCQNQSIDDSNADLAKDLRVLLRERLKAGDTDEQAIDFIVARYGNFVLLKPPVQLDTLLLWFGPLLIFLLAGFIYWTLVHRKSGTDTAETAPPLSDQERRELQDILGKGQST